MADKREYYTKRKEVFLMKKLFSLVLILCFTLIAPISSSEQSIFEENKQASEEFEREVIMNLGIDTNSEAYKEYVSRVNQLMEIYNIDVVTFGLLIIDDYKTFMEGENSFINWSMISK